MVALPDSPRCSDEGTVDQSVMLEGKSTSFIISLLRQGFSPLECSRERNSPTKTCETLRFNVNEVGREICKGFVKPRGNYERRQARACPDRSFLDDRMVAPERRPCSYRSIRS